MRVAVASVLGTVALLIGASAAVADSATTSVTAADGRSDPVAYIPRVFTISGAASGAKHLYVKHRAAGGAACAPSAFTDSGTWVDAAFFNVAVNGAFSIQRILTWRTPGTWMFCYWLAAGEADVTTPIAQTITVRAPGGSIGAALSPNPVRAGDRATITVGGASEAPRRVYAKIRADDGTACGPTFDADPGGSMIDGWSVDGAFSLKAYVNNAVLGQYLVCMWLAGSSDDAAPVAGPVAQTFGVVRSRPVVVSSAAAVNCKTKRASRRFVARKVKSVCMRYRFSAPPAPGERFSLSFMTPGRRSRTYKTVRSTWPGGTSRTITTASLPAHAYKHRRGTWRAVLTVDGKQVNRASFRVS
jgi:hypothetical protein